MVEGKTVLAIVPARSGSKGIPDKNLALVGGVSLIGRAGQILSQISWLDRRIISTDSPRYAQEGERHGLAAPFLRPRELSMDRSTARDALVHALQMCEALDARTYDLVVVAEPTSPLREVRDVTTTVTVLLRSRADGALTVSAIDSKCHPAKLLRIQDGCVRFYRAEGSAITARQQLSELYARNGLCYCFRRETLLGRDSLITENTVPILTDRPVANIDEPLDLQWASFLLGERQGVKPNGTR